EPGMVIGRSALPRGVTDGGAAVPLAWTISPLGLSAGAWFSTWAPTGGSEGGGESHLSSLIGGSACDWARATLLSAHLQTATTPNRHSSPPSPIQPYRDRRFTILLLLLGIGGRVGSPLDSASPAGWVAGVSSVCRLPPHPPPPLPQRGEGEQNQKTEKQ